MSNEVRANEARIIIQAITEAHTTGARNNIQNPNKTNWKSERGEWRKHAQLLSYSFSFFLTLFLPQAALCWILPSSRVEAAYKYQYNWFHCVCSCVDSNSFARLSLQRFYSVVCIKRACVCVVMHVCIIRCQSKRQAIHADINIIRLRKYCKRVCVCATNTSVDLLVVVVVVMVCARLARVCVCVYLYVVGFISIDLYRE